MSLLNQVIKFLLYGSLVASFIMWAPGWLLLDIKPRTYRQTLPRTLSNYTSIDQVKVKQLTTFSSVHDPESIAVFGDQIVTGSSDGWIYRINTDDLTAKPLVRVIQSPAKACLNPQDEPDVSQRYNRAFCGRPLGIKFDSKGALYVVEPSHGIFRIDNLFDSKPKLNLVLDIQQTSALGRTSTFIDDLAIEETPDGHPILYFSDVSTQFHIDATIYVGLSSERGRIVRYDTKTKKMEALVTDVEFPNGVEITPDYSALLFALTFERTVCRYHLKGARKGVLEKVIHTLPGEPDNIRVSSNGKTYWVAILKPRSFMNSTDLDYYLKKPLLRKIVLRASHLIGTVLMNAARITQNEMLASYAHHYLSLDAMSGDLVQAGGMLLEIDADGKIVSNFYSNGTDLASLSEVREVVSPNANQRVVYLGSYKYPGLRRLVYEP